LHRIEYSLVYEGKHEFDTKNVFYDAVHCLRDKIQARSFHKEISHLPHSPASVMIELTGEFDGETIRSSARELSAKVSASNGHS